MRAFVLVVVLGCSWAAAHDLSFDLTGTLSTNSSNNPRAGSLGALVSGTYDVSDTWSVLGTFGYTRDFAKVSQGTSVSGSNIFLGSVGVLWLPTDSLMMTLAVVGSPPTVQRSITPFSFTHPLTGEVRSGDAVVDSQVWSLGGVWTGTWLEAPNDTYSSAVDVSVGVNGFDVYQQLQLGTSPNAVLARTFCESFPDANLCQLVAGVSTPLVQTKLSAAYTATVAHDTDVGVNVGGSLYSRDPNDAGYFSILVIGRGFELGSGVPILPLAFTVRPTVAHRFERVSLKLSYQVGVYLNSQGTNHVASLRANVRLTEAVRLSVTVTGQADLARGSWSNFGAVALVGGTYLF